MRTNRTRLIVAGLAAAGYVIGTAHWAAASSKAREKQELTATADAPANAGGKASLSLRHRTRKGTTGSFTVAASHLAEQHGYDLIVAGTKVGTLTTNSGGSGRAKFDTSPRGVKSLLGFDPRGTTVVLRDQSTGDDDLVGVIPDDTAGEQACCIGTGETEDDGSSETECEDVDAAICSANGGTPQWVLNPDGTPSTTPVTSCLPDPCNNASTSTVEIACCINSTHDEGTEAECEDFTEAACAAAGGTVVQVPGATPGSGNPCDANPCQTAQPPSTPPASCCVPHTSSNGTPEAPECEDLTAAACTAAGGVPPSGGLCDGTVPCP